MSAKSINEKASELLKHPKVTARVEELKKEKIALKTMSKKKQRAIKNISMSHGTRAIVDH